MSSPDELKITIELGDEVPARLDKALASAAPAESGLTRTKITRLLQDGHVTGPDGVVSPKDKPIIGASYHLPQIETDVPVDLQAEDIPLDIVFEDDDLMVVNKPAGLVVHPAPGSPTGTLANGLLHHFGRLSGEAIRPGIVHRIDKDTSGLLVVAKTDAALAHLQKQFADHSIERRYLAVCRGVPSRADPRIGGIRGVGFEKGGIIRIATLLARHKTDRKRQAVVDMGGRHALTRIKLLEDFGAASLVECQLETGRTHQIRVHMSYIGHSLIGDQTYGRAKLQKILPDLAFSFDRQALHAAVLGFIHPNSGDFLRFQVDLPDDMAELVDLLRAR